MRQTHAWLAFLVVVGVFGVLLLGACGPNVAQLQREERGAELLALLASDRVTARSASARALGQLCERRSRLRLQDGTRCGDFAQPLIRLLEDPSRNVRIEAVRALGSVGSSAIDSEPALYESAANALAELLLGEDATLRREAVTALTRMGWKPAAGRAGAVYWAERGMWDECAKMGPDAVPVLIAALDKPSEELYLALGDLCASLENGDLCAPAVGPLSEALSGEHVSSSALALGTIARGLTDAQTRADIVRALDQALQALDPSQRAKERALVLGSLGWTGEASAVPVLVAHLASRTECPADLAMANLCCTAELALADLCQHIAGPSPCEDAVQALRAQLSGACDWAARQALGEIGARLQNAEARGRVAAILQEDLLQRCRAGRGWTSDVWPLARLGAGALAPLRGLLQEKERMCQLMAIEGLQELGSELADGAGRAEASDMLRPLLLMPELRKEASLALVALHRDQVGELVAMLNGPGTLFIYHGLIVYGVAEAEGALIDALWRHGDSNMALAFVNSGNGTLEAEGRKWASHHGYMIVPMPGVSGGPVWGGRR